MGTANLIICNISQIFIIIIIIITPLVMSALHDTIGQNNDKISVINNNILYNRTEDRRTATASLADPGGILTIGV